MATRGLGSQLVGQTFQALTTAANSTPADGAGFNVSAVEADAFLVQVIGGSQGSINATFQHALTDVNASYAAVPDAQIEVPRGETVLPSSGVIALTSATTGFKKYGYKGNLKFLRVVLSGAAGTPNFGIMTAAVAERRRHIGGS